MKAYTYFSHVPNIDPEHEQKLILLWSKQWAKMGWEPIVIGEYQAQAHPLYAEFNERIKSLPSVNPTGYDRACYLRWLAMNQIGGGLMVDYDTFLYDPEWSPVPDRKGQIKYFTCFQGNIPACVWGSTSDYLTMLETIMDYKVTEKDKENYQGHLHVSDMYILANSNVGMKKKMDVKNYGEEGWETSPLVHYSHSSMHPQGRIPRYQFVPSLRS